MNPQVTERSYFGAAVFFACLAILVFLSVVAFGWLNPTDNPPGGSGAITVDASANVGVGIAPTTKLDVNGTTKFRGLIDAFSNRITNLATPTVGTDAVNKDYVDSQYGGANASKIWGEGRPGVVVVGTGVGDKECDGNPATIKVSRGNTVTHWDQAAAGCPAGWWICSAGERGSNACGLSSENRTTFLCESVSLGSDDLSHPDNNWAWVADKGGSYSGGAVSRIASSPLVAMETGCYLARVWCCSLQ